MGWDELPQEKMTSVTVDDVAWQNGKHIFEELKKQKRWRSEVTNPNFSSIGQGRVYSEDESCGVAGRLWFWAGLEGWMYERDWEKNRDTTSQGTAWQLGTNARVLPNKISLASFSVIFINSSICLLIKDYLGKYNTKATTENIISLSVTNIFFGFFFQIYICFVFFSVSFCYLFWSNLLWRLGLSVKSWNSQHKELCFIYWILHTALHIYCWRIKTSKIIASKLRGKTMN